jgi:hypothetical protein
MRSRKSDIHRCKKLLRHNATTIMGATPPPLSYKTAHLNPRVHQRGMMVARSNALIDHPLSPSTLFIHEHHNLTAVFAQLANLFGSDKSSTHYYHLDYGILLHPFIRDCEHIKLMEIGVHQFSSMKLWQYLFPNAKRIVGVDKNENKQIIGRLRIYGGDQESIPFLEQLISNEGEAFDVIIDDGGHTGPQQQTSFAVLFPNALKRRGLYVIEDIQTSYYNGVILYNKVLCGGLHHPSTTVEMGKRKIVEVLSRKESTIESVYFCSNLIAFRKA